MISERTKAGLSRSTKKLGMRNPSKRTRAFRRKGWKGRLVNLPPGDTEGVRGLCLDPHDLAIAKYVARRDKDIIFTRELAKRGIVSRDRLLDLLDQTPVSEEMRDRIRVYVTGDFGAQTYFCSA